MVRVARPAPSGDCARRRTLIACLSPARWPPPRPPCSIKPGRSSRRSGMNRVGWASARSTSLRRNPTRLYRKPGLTSWTSGLAGQRPKTPAFQTKARQKFPLRHISRKIGSDSAPLGRGAFIILGWLTAVPMSRAVTQRPDSVRIRKENTPSGANLGPLSSLSPA